MFKTKIIPYGIPYMQYSAIFKILTNIFKGNIQEGPDIEKLEKSFARYIGTKYAVSFASGRAGLYLAYKYFNCKNKKVVLPSYTCIPSIDAARWVGSIPRFVDIDLNSYNPVFNDSIKKLKNIGAISLTYLYGLIGDIEPFMEFAHDNDIPIIEDAAIALGASYKNKKAGSIGDIGVFSLQESKIISGWRGGIVTTNDSDIYEYLIEERKKMDKISNSKILFNASFSYLRILLSGSYIYPFTMYPLKRIMISKYFVSILGKIMNFNPIESLDGVSPEKISRADLAKLTNLQASFALQSFKKIDRIIDKRRKLAKILISQLVEEKKISIPKEDRNIKHIYGRFPIRINGVTKFQLNNYFLGNGIEISLNYPYIIPNTYFMKKYGFKESNYPNALKASKETFLLPFHLLIKKKDILYMAHVVKNFLNNRIPLIYDR